MARELTTGGFEPSTFESVIRRSNPIELRGRTTTGYWLLATDFWLLVTLAWQELNLQPPG